MPDPDVVTGGTSLLPHRFAVKLCCAETMVGRMDAIVRILIDLLLDNILANSMGAVNSPLPSLGLYANSTLNSSMNLEK
jgi:hypothetical protein